MFNIQQMMQKAQAMQKKMAALQEELADVEVSGSAGGGLVQVVMTCKGALRSLSIDPSLINPAEKEMLEDMVKAAACKMHGRKQTRKCHPRPRRPWPIWGSHPGCLVTAACPSKPDFLP